MKPTTHPPDQRLARLHRWCNTGRLAAAELELSGWCRDAEPPAGARLLLATIKARRGALSEARDVLAGPKHSTASLHADGLKMRISLHTLLNEHQDAAQQTRRLHEQFGESPSATRWLAVSDAPGVSRLPVQSAGHAARLAESLAGRTDLIPTLVFAQKQRPGTAGIAMLRGALLRLVPIHAASPEDSLVLCRGLAALAQLAGDEDEARRWAHRGLKIDPYGAELAMILSWVPDEASAGDLAVDVLARVHARYPGYQDVSVALRRRRDDESVSEESRRAA